ncbi:MAG: carbon-nitrogen hydrolase family protein [Alphaproteobacteria bacterium]|nr:carbon-nitrogen hydrolase family protein [Alphaproteobacteria bacterium]
MVPFSIAGIQMQLGHGSNLDAIRQRIDLTMHLYPWVQMVMLSELAMFGPLLHHAQPLPGATEEELQTIARHHRIWLINGSMYERREGGIFNTTSVIDPEGRIVGRYRKMFPFTPLEAGVQPGEEFFVWDIEGVGRFGLLNCYDMWFPETSRQLTAMGAEVILHPVITHTIDRDIDLVVAHATSAMMQCYVFDINGLGAGGNGQSAVFDPAGRKLHQADATEQIIPIEIDLEQVRRSRERGIRGLGQMAESFRDRPTEFPVYREGFDRAYLDSLGALATLRRADGPPPANVQTLQVRRTLAL